jgi:hypothetical protein
LTTENDLALRRALEAAGVEFIDENGGGPEYDFESQHREKPGNEQPQAEGQKCFWK